MSLQEMYDYALAESTTPEAQQRRAALAAIAPVLDEATDLAARHGAMPATVEAVYFHTARAYDSLSVALLAKEPDRGRQINRLVHLAAVCVRAAEALREEQQT